MGEAIVLVVSLCLVVGVPALTVYAMRRGRLRAWRAAAQELGLTDVSVRSPLGVPRSMTGRLGRREARFQVYDRKDGPHGTLVVLEGDSGVSLCRESFGTTVNKAMGEGELEIGDEEFDRCVYARGDPAVLRAVLDSEAPRRARSPSPRAERDSSASPGTTPLGESP